jgi:hypothetical protein
MATVAHQLERALQAQMHDVAVRSHADRSRKYTACRRPSSKPDRQESKKSSRPVALGSLRSGKLPWNNIQETKITTNVQLARQGADAPVKPHPTG